MTKRNKIEYDAFIYCKATGVNNFYWIVYDSDEQVISKGSGFGKYESVIHATLAAILDSLQQCRIELANRRVKVSTDVQWIADNLNHGSVYSSHLIQLVSDIRTLELECRHVSIKWCPKFELIEYIPFAKAVWEAKQKEHRFVSDKFIRQSDARDGSFIDYHQYMFSDAWKIKSSQCKEQAGYKCRLCNRGLGDITLVAHHRTYARLGNEHLDDLTCLCVDCHELFEKHSNYRPSKQERVTEQGGRA